MTLSLAGIRRIAEEHGYEEIDCKEESRVISFRGGSNKSIRINVYYTTGTVGTCLNHPQKGKTQLFRRNIDCLELLEAIFENPRLHTGEGYYQRKNIRQNWKRLDTNETICDTARRWNYVGFATGLFKNEREKETVMEISAVWDDMIWTNETRPRSGEIACGARSALMEVLCEVVRDTWGDFEVHHCDEINKKNFVSDKFAKLFCGDGCSTHEAFIDAHSNELRKVKQLIMSLRKDLRAEIVQWFLQARVLHSHELTDRDSNYIVSKFHGMVDLAHVEYGEQNYPRHTKMCDHCGTV